MFRIGEFSRFSRVSVKMLRHYDELGLVKPAWVDPYTGYRYYAADQLPRLNRIVALKDLGFRLEQIGTMLDGDLSNEELRGILKLRRAELEQELQAVTTQLAQVETRLLQLEHAATEPTYDVVLRPIAPQMVAAIRQSVGGNSGLAITALFEELEAYVARHKARAPLPPLMLYHDLEFMEQAEDIEVMVPVQKPLPANERVVSRELAGHGAMASLILTGGYDGLSAAFAVLLQWIEQNGYTIVGPTREVFLRFGANQDGYHLPEAYLAATAAEFVTELQIPVAQG